MTLRLSMTIKPSFHQRSRTKPARRSVPCVDVVTGHLPSNSSKRHCIFFSLRCGGGGVGDGGGVGGRCGHEKHDGGDGDGGEEGRRGEEGGEEIQVEEGGDDEDYERETPPPPTSTIVTGLGCLKNS